MDIQNFGRYEIVGKLGQGGMSDVYLAYDPNMDRHVALKVLPAAMLHEPGFRERFDREAKLIANLEHPAIIPVYEYGEHNNQPYLVMRYMRGGTLADRSTHVPLNLNEVDRIIQPLCSALDKAHNKKIIHRDIKPQNILFDEDRRPYLGDFGIARMAEGTQTMTIVGTPNYMAPEQAHGRDLDRRTDVYQMGVVMFEMLTGKQPYDAPTPVALLHQHAYAPIPSLREFNDSLPPACEAVVNRALAKEKQDRYQTAGQLASDFSAACQGMLIAPVDPTAPTVVEGDLLAGKRAYRTGLALIVGAGIIIGLIAIGLMLYFPEIRSIVDPESSTPGINIPPATPGAVLVVADGGSNDLTQEARSVAMALKTVAAETEIAALLPANTPDVEPTSTAIPMPTNTLEPSPTFTPVPSPTKTRRPSPTNTPRARSVDDFPFGRGIIVVGGGYGSVEGAREHASTYRSRGYDPVIFFRNDDIRVVLTGYGSKADADRELPRVLGYNSQAYTRDLSTWCPEHRVNEDGYECG